ncbi:hypothetical protein ACTFIV_007802 [Dictyostelium citrinum]
MTTSTVEVTTANNNGVVTPLDELNIEIKKKDAILQCFYDIASMDSETRLQSITTLVQTLEEIQSIFKPEDHKDISRIVPKIIEKSEIFNNNLSPELNYTLKRLVIGLASTRDSARIGFSMALSEVLHSFKDVIELPWFFDFLAYHMDLSGKNLTEKESHFGRLFGMMSIIRSSRLEGLPIVQTQPSKSINYDFNRPPSDNMIECIVEQLLYISKKRSIYSELSFEILSSLFEQLSDSNFDKLWPFIKPIIPQSHDEYTPDLLSLLLLISKKFKKFNLIKQTVGWKHPSILNLSNLSLLKNVFSESCKSHPRIHKVWRITFEILLADNEENATLVEFWKYIVEENLFKTTSMNKKYLGLQLFEMLLPLVHPEIIVDIFSENVIVNLSESLKPTSPLHEVGSLAFQSIPKTAEISSQHRLALILFFSNNSHHYNQNPQHQQQKFEQSISVDVINELIKDLDEDSIKIYLNSLYKSFIDVTSIKNNNNNNSKDEEEDDMVIDEMNNEEKSEKYIESTRHWILSQIGHISKDLVKRSTESLIKLEPMLLELLQFLYFHSYYLTCESVVSVTPATPVSKGKKKVTPVAAPVKTFTEELFTSKPKTEISQSIRDQCFIRFCSVLEELSYLTLEPTKPSSISYEGTMSNGEFWASKLASFQYDLLKKGSTDSNRPQLSTFLPMGIKPIDRIMKIVQSIQSKQQSAEKRLNQLVGFELLFVHVSLHYLTDPQEISEIIEDLTSAFEELTNPQPPQKSTKKRSAPEPEKPQPFMVLLDVLISLLDKPIHILRTIIKQIFSIFADNISFQVLEHILTMIKAPTDELFNGLDGGDEDDEDDEDDEFKPISPEELKQSKENQEEEEEDDEDEEDEEDDEEDSEDSDSDDDNTVNPELVARLKQTMGKHLLLDEDDEDEDLLEPTEEEAKMMDNYLKEVFKSKKEKKSNYQDIKTQTINLKSRLIDLLESYVKKFLNNPNEYIFKMIPLMIEATSFDEPSISNRFISLFKNKFSQIRTTTDNSVNVQELNQLLSSLFDTILSSKHTGSSKDKEQQNNNSSAYILSGHAIYMIVRVLLSIKPTTPVVQTPSKKSTKSTKSTATNTDSTPSEYGSLDIKLFSSKLDSIIECLLDRNNIVPSRFFAEFAQRFPTVIWASIKKVTTIIESPQNDYNSKKILDVLSSIVKRKDSYGANGKNLLNNASDLLVTLCNSLNGKEKQLKPNSIFDHLNLINQIVFSCLQVIKSNGNDNSSGSLSNKLGSESCKLLESTLCRLYKLNNKQNIKDTSKKILLSLGLENNEIFELEKQKKLEKQQKKETQQKERQSNKEKSKQEIIERIEQSKQERKNNKSTDSKVDNKNKSRPKKKVEDDMEVVDDIFEEGEEKSSKKNNNKKDSNKKSNDNNIKKETTTKSNQKETTKKSTDQKSNKDDSQPMKKKQKK